MKKILPLLLATSLLLSACSIDFNTANEDIFKKKQECAKLNKAIETELLKEQKDDQIQDQKNKGSTKLKYGLEQVFYSPKVDNCVYVMKMDDSFGGARILREYGNRIGIGLCRIDYDSNDFKEECEKFEILLQELKGE